MAKRGIVLLDADHDFVEWLGVWQQRLPWGVKIEGKAVFERREGEYVLPFAERMARFPPIVARNLVVVDDILWSPLWNSDRCIRKLVSRGTSAPGTLHGRTEDEEYVLVLSAFMTLKLHVYWHVKGRVWNPTVQALLDNHWYTKDIRRLVEACVASCYRESARRTPCHLRR